jgi:hypothetical protein
MNWAWQVVSVTSSRICISKQHMGTLFFYGKFSLFEVFFWEKNLETHDFSHKKLPLLESQEFFKKKDIACG